LIRKGDFNMASRKFRFVSPGVFLKEIDNSQLPRTPEGVGPVIIGRTRKGPAMKPYKVRSLEEFERVFGKPMPGNQGEDPWRDGTGILAESYLPYAAKAYLSADIDSPITVVRLAGVAGDDAVANGAGEPGWEAQNAWGIFLMENDSTQTTGSLELGAIFYGADSSFGIKMKGIHASGGASQTVSGSAIKPASGKFTVQLSSSAGTREVSFAFDDIRKDFNTNPVMTNTTISSIVSGTLAHHYWLGETFEQTYQKLNSSAGSNGLVAVAMQLTDGMDDFKSLNHGLTSARSGWVFGNDTSGESGSYNPDNQQRLFRLLAINDGFDASRELIISIEDIKPARTGAVDRFGTFSVVVKQITPSRLVEIERFDGCNLNPDSSNYIARRIGDMYMEWDSVQKRNKMYGSHLNVSEFIRVEMNQEIETQGGPINVEQVPFGFYGPIVPKTFTDANFISGAAVVTSSWAANATLSLSGAIADSALLNVVHPYVPVVTTGSTAQGQTGGYMFGASANKMTWASGSGKPLTTINKGYVDFVRIASDYGTLITDQTSGLAGTDSQVAFKFSLDDVILTPKSGVAEASVTGPGQIDVAKWVSGSRVLGTAWSAKADASSSVELRTMLDIVDGFHMPLVGGNDGVDITQADPFNMGVVNADATTATSYAYASIDRAIEMIRDPEMVEHNLAAMPGVTNTSLTTKLVRTCEARADSLAIIDLPDVYIPPFQAKCTSFKDRVDNVTPETSAKNLVARQINSSYGATYYPWVKIKDEQFNRDVWVPPSVVALGVMAYTEERDDVWFAPAGFNRGGLNTGNAGLPVLQASEQLLSKDRDTLYAANINPIAQFVSEGLVIFGQKTLQSDQSALDRINVRRLLIFVKKEISRISNGLLFEQNVQATWARFTNQVVPFLQSVKTRFGLSDFKVVLDDTTTTPDLIDRNIMYAKVFLKPARSIEFIAVDFVITNTGASFED
jgi:hypothetical protein